MFIPFNMLPEAKDWKIGQTYRVRVVLRQNAMTEDGATFELLDATSMEREDRDKRRVMTDEGGYLKL